MKTIRYTILIITIISINSFSILAQDNLKLEVINFMKEYEKYCSFTKDGLSYEESYKGAFLGLFVRTGTEKSVPYQTFNDIEKGNKPPYITQKDYVERVRKYFPKGINTEVNIRKIGKEKILDKHKAEVEVTIKKKLFGLNSSDKIYKEEFELTILLRFTNSKNAISKMKIVSISAKGFPREPSGLFIGINLQPSLSNIGTSEFLNENSTYGSWSQNGKLTFNGGIEVNYYFDNPLLGIGTRINYTSYQSSFDLNTYHQSPVNLTDVDNDSYNLIASGEQYKETAKLNFIEIPIFIKFRFVFHKTKLLNHVYANLGPVFSLGISTSFNTKGVFTYKGYYPEYHVVLHDIDEYDYYTNKDFASTPESNLKSLNILGLAEIGINMPLSGEKLNLNISLFYQQGLLNLSEGNEDYVMTLGYNKNNALIDSRAKVSTSLFGINIGILYKIF